MFAIVIVHKPTGKLESEPEWNNFLNKIGQIKETFSNVIQLQENIYQIELNTRINDLASITSVLIGLKISYRVLLLADEPQWLFS